MRNTNEYEDIELNREFKYYTRDRKFKKTHCSVDVISLNDKNLQYKRCDTYEDEKADPAILYCVRYTTDKKQNMPLEYIINNWLTPNDREELYKFETIGYPITILLEIDDYKKSDPKIGIYCVLGNSRKSKAPHVVSLDDKLYLTVSKREGLTEDEWDALERFT